jgi:predicted AlkP superfamily pyrophosphatase or phosphodiesterase
LHKTVVICVVGLTPDLLGDYTPRLSAFARGGAQTAVAGMTPAVTSTVQSTYLTGMMPSVHGVVANGWYHQDTAEIRFWQQSNRLVQAPKVWELARAADPGFSCANLFWWFNMYSSVDYAVTPRPMYLADGRKLPDVHSHPGELRHALQAELGQFPLFRFWGPASSIESSRWIAEAAKFLERRHDPTLSLVYLPHLDYGLQQHGPDLDKVAPDLRAVDQVCGDLIDFFEERDTRVVVVSEYGITPVSRPVHLNRELRRHGFITIRDELGREMLDAGASRAFAVADHQVAHVYVANDDEIPAVRALLESVPGVDEVLDVDGKREHGLDHPRSGDLVALSERDAWFTYYFWLDDQRAPDYARTVDIHRKPGYDPVELFLDPALRIPQLKIAATLAKRKAGLRSLLDVIPLDASLVRGSHGRAAEDPRHGPLLLTRHGELLDSDRIAATDVAGVILRHLDAPVPAPGGHPAARLAT